MQWQFVKIYIFWLYLRIVLFFLSRVVHINSHELQYLGRTVLVSLVAEAERLVEIMRCLQKSYPISIENGSGSNIKEPGPFRQGFVYKHSARLQGEAIRSKSASKGGQLVCLKTLSSTPHPPLSRMTYSSFKKQ